MMKSHLILLEDDVTRGRWRNINIIKSVLPCVLLTRM